MQSAVVVGVGASAGLGASIARRFAREGLAVTMMGRSRTRLQTVADEITEAGGKASAFVGDATAPGDMSAVFDAASSKGTLVAAIFNAGGNRPGSLLETDSTFFEEVWRVGCLAGHLFAREAAGRMATSDSGTILFTGASASLRGKAGFAAFAAAKAGLRAVAQATAREYGPKGLHVAHIVIDGIIDGERALSRNPTLRSGLPPDGLLSLEAIAETYWAVHRQHRSAWTHELDLRPWCEPF